MTSIAVSATGFLPEPLPLCAHCGLPLAGGRAARGPSYCCSGCALAHRLTGGAEGHGRATGLLMAVGIGAFLAMNVMMLSFVLYSGSGEADRAAGEGWVRWALLVLATPALVLLGGPFLTRGARHLRLRRLDTDALILIGVSAAYGLSARSVVTGEGPLYLDTAMGILLFVTLGRYLEAAARARTTDALASLVRQMPEEAARVRDGVEEKVSIAELRPGDFVRVRPGERIPADGVIVEGEASVSQAEITGEPAPVSCAPGSRVGACTLNLDGSLLIEVERTGGETTVARIVRLVEESRASGYPLAPLVDRVAALFVPVVLVIALATFVYWTWRSGTGEGLLNALSVLLIACPCAIGIATPLVSTVAAGRAAAAGVLVRSGAMFERLARSQRIFFDKTGTLTTGEMRVAAVHPAPGVPEETVLAVAAALEEGSEHPIARAVRAAFSGALPPVESFRAVPGRGVLATVRLAGVSRDARLGSAAFVGGAPEVGEEGATLVHLALDGVWQGTLTLRDSIRASSREAVAALVARGLAVEVLSGDTAGSVAAFGADLPGLAAAAGLSPEDKRERIRAAAQAGDHPVMVGDGINDAPALSSAAVAVTLASGTDLAREVADVTLLGGDLRRLPWLIALSEKTLRTARTNLFLSFAYNTIGMGLAVAGLLHPLFGAVGMVASSLLVVIRSQRLAKAPLP
ncbi:MAG TPA: cation-translocating P-type ATPase [Thermoanaerobaculia bacterium]|nr:cation-translocating P-type ATPase [Thermoanaerobaculia bacterium]